MTSAETQISESDYPEISLPQIEYPESDGKPMAETDFQRVYVVYATEVLDIFFQDRPDVYVSGNICFYYEPGRPQAYLSPDAFVVFGIPKRQRRTYRAWEEGKYPDFVLEITSKSTQGEDQGNKKSLYAAWGIREYFQYDPTGDYLQPPLQGLSLMEDGSYQNIPAITLDGKDYAVASATLGLELRLLAQELRFYNPETQEILLSHRETELARRQAELRAEQEAQRAEQEAQRADRLAAKLRELGIDPDQV